MTERPDEPTTQQNDDLEKLNPEGAGLGAGADNTFEPEEDDDAPVEGTDKD
ncbi:MAG: hypothetical protein Q4F67_05420 [Propionibacteriaceae bacterium]|nr:hypothetical protein [Propionibacteriaceae bacterium]